MAAGEITAGELARALTTGLVDGVIDPDAPVILYSNENGPEGPLVHVLVVSEGHEVLDPGVHLGPAEAFSE